MNRIIFTLILITLFSSNILTAQSDCSTAFLITNAAPTSYTPTSGGAIDDIACSSNNQQGCLATGELQSAWYYFEMDPSTPPNSPLGFIISPTTAGDYDFALYGPTTNGVNCSNLGAPISCDYHPNSITGLSNPIANGFQPLINVNAGEGYFLLVSNFSQNNSGFNLIWSEAASGFFNPSPTPPSPCDLGNNPLTNIVACPGDPPVSLNPGSSAGGSACSVAMPMYSWTGSGAPFLTANNIPNPSMTIPPVPGVYNLSLTIQSGATCMSTENMTVTVATPPVVNILPAPALCTDGSATSLTANPPGGSWSPNAPGGVVNPAALSPGPNIVTYDYVDPVSGCTGNGMTTVMVNLPPVVTIPPIPPLCIQDIPNPYAPVANPPGGTWSSEVIGGVLLPQILGAGQTTITYTYTDPITGCTTTEPTTVTVLPQPQVTFVDPGPICAFGMPAVLVAIPPGGTWGPGAPNSLFDPSNLGPGTYPVDYTYADPFGCQTVATYDVVVTGGSAASIQSPNNQNTFCTSEGNQTLIGSPAGGSWSTNAPNGTIDPSALGLGSHTITYVINDPSLGCSTPGIFMITVNGPPVVSINGVGSLCNTSSPVTLTGNPTGGTWSANAPGGVFNPAGLSDGSYQVTYTFTDPASNCSDSEDINIQVNSSPSITMNGPTSFCANNTSTLTVDGGFANYEWSNSGNTNSITVNAEGTYTVTVTDANGCSTTASQFVAQSSNLTPTITPSQTAICDGNPATLTADGGYSSYQWSTTENTPMITVTQTGTYTVTVTDANNCTGESSFTINALTSPQPMITGNASFCSGETTTIDAGSWTSYIWSDNSTNQTLTVGAPATYSVTVTDANGCTGVDQYQVSENTIATPIIQGNFEICPNDNTTLSLGTTYSSYQWSTGSTDPTVTISQNETITVTVTDANNCTSISAPQMVTVNAAPSFMISGSNTFCQGTSIPLDAGTWDSYLWSDNSTSQTIMVNTPGTYTVTVTNASNCEGTAEIMVDVSASLQPNIIGNETPCINEQNTLDAGGGFASYEWSNSMTTQTITTNQSGTFTVTVTDATGCTGEDFITITPNPVPMPTFTGEPSFCTGETASVDAGTWITYLWSDNSTGPTLSTSTAGTYTVTVTDASNCTGTNEIVITESNIASPPFSGDTNFCQGGSTVIDAGPGYSSYTWSNGGTSQTNTISTDGVITVTVTNAAGCEFIAPITITENPLPTPTILGSTSFCSGNSTTLDAGAWNSYQWSDNSTDQMLTVSAAGTYTVTVTDFNNCTGTEEVVVIESASLQPNIDGAIDFCEGTPNLLDAGSGFDSYQWSNNMSTQTISPTETGTYSVTVSDASNCTGTGEITITAIPNPMPTITGENSFCSGGTATVDAGTWDTYLWSEASTTQTLDIGIAGTYTVTVTNSTGCIGTEEVIISENNITIPAIPATASFCQGESTMLDAGAGYTSYMWSNGDTDQTTTITTDGTVSVTVTNAGGCETIVSSVITENPTPSPTIAGSTSFCTGNSTTLDAGTWDTYLWSDNSTNNEITVTQAGTYTVTVTNTNGCIGTEEIDITIDAQLQPSIVGDSEICEGTAAALDAGNWDTYIWSEGSTSQTINPTESGTYTVTVSDVDGCTGVTQANVLVNNNPVPQISGSASFCVGTTTTLDAGSWDIYEWSDNSTDQILVVGTAGTYTVTVTNTNGCTGTTEIMVTESTSLNPSISGELGFCTNENTLLDAGQGFASYLWSDNSTGQTLEVTASGTYAVTVMDASGCMGETSVAVVENTPPNPTIIGATSFCTGNSTIIDAGAFDSYLWSDGSLSQTLEVFISGTYTVVVSDMNGCTGEASIDVSELSSLDPMVIGPNALCPDDMITLEAAGGFVSYVWSDNSTSATLAVSSGGTYTVTVTDANNCTGEQTVSILQNTPPSPSITGATEICIGTSTTLDADAGFASYVWSDLSTDASLEVSQAGIYTVTVTDANGCTGTMEEEVTELTAPNTTITGTPNFCPNESTIVEADAGFSTYIWSDGSTTATTSISVPGTYTVTITDLNGCTNTEEISITENTPPSPTLVGASSFCSGNSTILDASGTYTDYLWSDNSTDPTLEIFISGTYSVTVTDMNGCTGTMEQVVTETTSLLPAITGATSFCPNETVMIEAEVGYIDYEWSNLMTTSNIEVTASGTYTVTVTDASGCTGTNEISIMENTPPMPSIAGSTSFCTGSTTTLDVGNTYDQYLWSDGSTNSTLEVATDGIYSVTVTDLNGCTGIESVQVIESTQLNPNISGDDSFCTGTSTLLDAGSGFTTYEWSNSSTDQTIDVTTPGTFTVTVTDLSGCTGETSLVVSEDIPVNAGTANAPTNLCGADVSLIMLQNELTGADANGQWIETSNTASTGGAFNATMGMFNTDGQSAGTYTFDYFIAGNGTCPDDVETVTVVIEESPVAMISAPANIITCIQSDITLDANGSQGDALQYLWTTIGNGNIVSGNTTATPIIDTEGVYLLTVTSGNGCTATSEISITESITMPDADAGTNQNITCDDSSVTLNGTTTILNPIFTWTGNGINADNMNLPNPTVDEAGVYTLVVTDANNGCESTPVSTTVTTDDNIPTFTLDPVGNLDCINNSQILTGPISPNFAYQWLFNGNVITGATEPNFEAMEPGTYSLVITDNLNGCEGTATLNVMASTDLPTAEAGTADLLTCEAGSVSLNGNGSSTDPNGTFIYSWLDPNGNEIPNSNALSINVDQAGPYTLVVFNTVNGCQSTDFVLVEADGDVPVADAGANTMLDCDFSAIQIGGNSTTGNGITYTWTSPTGGTISNNTIPNPEINEPGTYQLLVTDTNNGCDATDEIIISENNNVPTDAIIEVNPITCFGDSDASIIIGEITGGTAPYEFSLNGNGPSNVNQFSFLGEGDYTIQVIDDEGCQWEMELFIPEPPEFVLNLGEDQTIQLTESTQITAEAISPIQVIEWRPDSTLSCLDCIDPIATPFTTTTYQATASNERGCESTDQITIFVEKNRDVYFPNVFTPNGDGNNDMFYPQSGNIVEKIHVFQVYTRWGEVVYEVKDVLPNDMSIGWDGTFKGQKLNPAVFVYYADVEFIDGVKLILKGDVALRR